ncbi:flagellar motor switch protein FliM [Parendozoicomonas haliclonae]|uniref:Flagellar motor switch protein FliM n=1 Tax=Parendozoicomonas haliclonae TaxID=1960125 RepID=A0A1X7AGU7_9GAMM|nr:FliM/FliN family flagellar motor switch protein [Parendozoicomonas haliclonae]SMA39936.1 Flagellar motor switch protein FliM [Parendozoicomonas haliclonae]
MENESSNNSVEGKLADRNVSVTSERLEALLNKSRKNERIHVGEQFDGLQRFDLTNPDYKIHDLVPTLSVLYKRFAQLLKFSLYNQFRNNPEVEFTGVDSVKFVKFDTESPDNSLHIFKVNSLKSVGFVTVSNQLIGALIDLFFGGSGKTEIDAAREMSTTEKRMLNKFLNAAMENLQETWESILPFDVELQTDQSTPISTLFTNDTELLLVSRFKISMADTEGTLEIVLPYKSLEPIRERIQAYRHTDQDPHWENNLRGNVLMAPVEISATMCQVDLMLKDILGLKSGDIIQTNIPGQVTVKVSGLPCLKATVCTIDDSLALKIVRRLKPGSHERSYKSKSPLHFDGEQN